MQANRWIRAKEKANKIQVDLGKRKSTLCLTRVEDVHLL